MDDPAPASRAQSDRAVLRAYYIEKNFFTSVEGVLKVLSIVSCSAAAALGLAGGAGGCGAGLAAAAAAALLALLALLCAAALGLAARAPLAFFYADVTLCAALGAALLTGGVLGVLHCAARRALDFVHGPLAIANAGLVVSSAVATYAALGRRWERARRLPPSPPRPSRFELEV